MSVAPGMRLGPYEIVSRIGAGGMGEVWRAQDTRLDRTVAIKILPAEFARNAQLKVRFDREARAISQLNHPNICTLHDVGHENGVDYLVMELLEGENLAERLSKGPLPIEQVIRYGIQISEALARAHRGGIIHRDLKPANVVLTKNGAKLLDFGLAKSAPAVSTRSDDLATEARDATPLTDEGTILGTFQYMAPEQLEGTEADPRTDIFALGALLYEMVAGKRAFEGKTRTSLIAAIVDRDPTPISQIRPLTPPAFEHVVSRCLEKDPDARWQSAHDVAEELRWISAAGSQAGVAAPLVARRKSRERLWWITALIATIAAAAVLLLRRPVEPAVISSLSPPAHGAFEWFYELTPSPDGRSMVFVGVPATGKRSLWLRRFDERDAKQLPQTEGADLPFWSPDGESIAFFADGKLKRIAAAGGPPRTLADVNGPRGGTWNRGGVIVFAQGGSGPLYRVSAEGGKPVELTKMLPREEAHRWPQFLPDGDHIIFLGDATRTEDHFLRVASLRDGSVKDLFQAVTNVVYAEGYILYVRGGSLLAQKFDAKKLRTTGEPQAIADQVVASADNHHFELAAGGGRLLFRTASSDSQLMWVDRSGKLLQPVGEPRRIDGITLSPDQQRIAMGTFDADGRSDDLWLIDERRGGAISRFTFDPASDYSAIWSPEGSKIAFVSMRSGFGDLYIADVENGNDAKKVLSTPRGLDVTSWSRDGEHILVDNLKTSDIDIWVYSTRDGKASPYLASPFEECCATFSPDGAWIAWTQTEGGRSQVYVERFPTHERRRQVSINGGAAPKWRADGRELYFANAGELMSVDMTSDSATPRPLFPLGSPAYVPASDGQKFLIAKPIDDPRMMPETLVTNWQALLKK